MRLRRFIIWRGENENINKNNNGNICDFIRNGGLLKRDTKLGGNNSF